MSINAKRIMELKRKGKRAPEIAKELKISRGHVYSVLRGQGKGRTATGVDRDVAKLAKAAGVQVPRHLNGLSKHWREAERMQKEANRILVRAKRIKAAVKELKAALLS